MCKRFSPNFRQPRYSPKHVANNPFLRLFKASTGLSPHAYLMMRRLELAKHLIQQGKTLAQAAYDAGFADQSHLPRHFKAAYGFTPGQFQHATIWELSKNCPK